MTGRETVLRSSQKAG